MSGHVVTSLVGWAESSSPTGFGFPPSPLGGEGRGEGEELPPEGRRLPHPHPSPPGGEGRKKELPPVELLQPVLDPRPRLRRQHDVGRQRPRVVELLAEV